MPHVLLVEDNEDNRDALSRRLVRRGYQVTTAVDGLQALKRAAGVAPDVVLLDMNLPEIDGWEVARRLRANPATARLPILALTAHAMAGDREKAIAAGCDDYHSKPIELLQLVAQIEVLLAR